MNDAVGWVPILKHEKQDDGTLLVTGKATDSSLDRDLQIADGDWLAKAMPAWFRDSANIREQHDGKRAVGVATEYVPKTDGHYITAKIVDPVTVSKIEHGVLKGFSFGARNARVAVDKSAAGGRIVGGDIFEVSVVDRPSNPGTLFTIAKADSAGELQPVEEPELVETGKADEPKFTPTQFAELLKGLGKTPATPVEDAAPVETEKADTPDTVVEKRDFTQAERDAAADAGEALPDGSFPIKTKGDLDNAIKAYGRAKDKAAAKKHIIKRARALDAIDQLPDDWNVSKADGILAQIAGMVPGRDITKDDAGEEIQDVSDGKAAIAAIARLIISEATSLAEGRMEEIWDIQTLVNAACALQCFVDSETWQEAALTMPKTDDAKAPAGEQPADSVTKTVAAADPVTPAESTEKTEAAPEGELTKTDLTELLQDAITKATKPLQDELLLVKGELAKVLETPQPGGPARMRTTTQTAVATKADTLRTEIALCSRQIPITSGDMQKGYRKRLEEAETELQKLDGAAA